MYCYLSAVHVDNSAVDFASCPSMLGMFSGSIVYTGWAKKNRTVFWKYHNSSVCWRRI